MLVWQDMVPGGEHWSDMAVTYLPTVLTGLQKREPSLKAVGRLNQQGRDFFEKEMEDAINALYSFPSIVTWVLFNEGWGQFDTKRLYEKMKKLDPNRPIDAASGWFDVGVSDYLSEHNYFRELKVHLDSKRAYVLSEYGGVAYPVKDHVSLESNYGYGKVQTQEEFLTKFKSLMDQIEKLKEEGLAGAIYTQVSDIEEETNGILTYDRKVNKLYDK
jgi:beta-galactosidase/beta-glucuronidase